MAMARWDEFLILLIVVAFTSAIFLWLPRMRRGGLLFGVTAPDGFRESAEGRGIVARYRIAIVAVTLAVLAVHAFGLLDLRGSGGGFYPLLQVVGSLGAWVWGWSRVRPFAAAPSAIRSAPLEAEEEPAAPWLIAVLSPMVLLAAASLYLHSLYDTLPDSYPTHWNASGVADSFSVKSWRTVFFPALMGCSLILMFAVNVWILLQWTRQGGRRSWGARFLQGNLRMMAIVAWVLGGIFSLVLLLPVLPQAMQSNLLLGVLAAPLLAVAVALLPLMKLSEEPTAETDQTPDECWKLGIVYYNPADSAVVVPKRDGVGYSMNFARRETWAYLCVALLLVLGPLVFLKLG